MSAAMHGGSINGGNQSQIMPNLAQQTDLEVIDLSSASEDAFRENYNRRPFVIQHKLSEHPLLQLDHLVELGAVPV